MMLCFVVETAICKRNRLVSQPAGSTLLPYFFPDPDYLPLLK